MTNTPNLNLTLVSQSQSQKEVTINSDFQYLEMLQNNGVISRTTTTPPGSPAEGDLYICGASSTGAWAGQDGKLAYFINAAWTFFIVKRGLTFWSVADSTVLSYNGSAYVSSTAGALSGLSDVSITAPANNDVLTYDSASSTWKNKVATVGSLSTLTDCAISTPTNGQFLKYNSGTGKWINSTSSATTSYSALTDVVLTALAQSDQTIYDGAHWINYSDEINVKAYAATGDGVTDDTTAIQNAMNAVIALPNGGGLYVPRGQYVYTTLAVTVPVGKSFYIRGAGENISAFINGTSITITFSSGKFTKGLIGAEKISVISNTAGGHKGLRFVSSNAPNPGPIKRVRECLFVGDNTTTYWDYGLEFDGCTYTDVRGCHFGGISASYAGGGINYTNAQTNHAVAQHVCDNYFWALDTGINAGDKIEGIEITNNDILANKGINWIGGTSGLPELSVCNNDIACNTYCIVTQNIIQMNISDNLFYNNTPAGANFTAIFVNNTINYSTNDNNQISDNTIMGFNGSTTNGIALANASYNMINNNRIDGVTTGIWLKSTTTACVADNNYCTNVTNSVLDQGTGNIVVAPGGNEVLKGALVYMTAAQAILNNTWTTVSWGTNSYDTAAIWDAATKFVMPSGYSFAEFKGQVAWANIATGQVRVRIKKNGVSFPTNSYIGSGDSTQAEGTNYVDVITPAIQIANGGGDYFEIEVFQSSGGTINIAPTNAKNQMETWFAVKLIR